RPDVVDRDDVGMIESRGGPRLLLEALQPRRIRRQLRRQHLDRHLARETRVPRPVHLSHPPGAQRRQDLVRTEAGARRHGHEISAPGILLSARGLRASDDVRSSPAGAVRSNSRKEAYFSPSAMKRSEKYLV